MGLTEQYSSVSLVHQIPVLAFPETMPQKKEWEDAWARNTDVDSFLWVRIMTQTFTRYLSYPILSKRPIKSRGQNTKILQPSISSVLSGIRVSWAIRCVLCHGGGGRHHYSYIILFPFSFLHQCGSISQWKWRVGEVDVCHFSLLACLITCRPLRQDSYCGIPLYPTGTLDKL